MVLSKHLHRLRKDQRGTVSIIMGLLIIPLVGALGIGFEVSNWHMTGRGMQNAADAVPLAAAPNGGANYRVQAQPRSAPAIHADVANNIALTASPTATPNAAFAACTNRYPAPSQDGCCSAISTPQKTAVSTAIRGSPQ